MQVLAVMVKHENFKTCDQSGFCKRNRAYADTATSQGSSWITPYSLDAKSISVKNGQLAGTILKSVTGGSEPVRLPLLVKFLESGAVRITVDEERRRNGDIELRHGSQARKERCDEVAKWAIVGGMTADKSIAGKNEKDATVIEYGHKKSFRAIIHHSPFSIDFARDDEVQIKLNGKGLMNVEHWRPKVEVEKKEEVEVEKTEGNEDKKEGDEEKKDEVEKAAEAPSIESADDESTWWEETFGGNTDSKPKGPESVGVDITFPGYAHVFGIPEHAGPLSLKETR